LQVISCRLFPALADTVDAVAPTVTFFPFCKTVGRAWRVVEFDANCLETQQITGYSPLSQMFCNIKQFLGMCTRAA